MAKAVWDGHFTNISFEIWVQPSYVDGLFGLPGDLGGILIYDVKIQDGGQWMLLRKSTSVFNWFGIKIYLHHLIL